MSGSDSQTYAPWQFNEYIIVFEGDPVVCILTGVYLAIAGTNLHLLLLERKKYKILLLYSIVQLVLTALYFTMSLYAIPAQTLAIIQITDPFAPGTLSAWPEVIINVAFVLNGLISDAFLLYRCYVICLGNRYRLAFPAFLFLATVGSSLAWLVLSSSTPGVYYSTHAIQLAGICYWACVITMNVCVSCLISVRLWMHRRAISGFLGSQRAAFYLGYIAMTLESASLYAVFAIVGCVVFTLNSPFGYVFIPVFGRIQAIAPSLIVYRIARGISFETDEYGSIVIGDLHFASSDRPQTITQSAHQDIPDGSGTISASSSDAAKTDQCGSDPFIHEISREV